MYNNINDDYSQKPDLRVVGVGGGGGNAINRMIENQIEGVTYIAINTDSQDLKRSLADIRIILGKKTNRGLGAGQNSELGEKLAYEDYDSIKEALKGADLVFITCGMGGGTGTGASPVVAQAAKELGSLVIGIVTNPFTNEGKKRRENALKGIERIKPWCDILIVIENDNLTYINDRNLNLLEAFQEVDSVLRKGVQGITEIILVPGLVNVDFADLKTTIENKGTALMGIGIASGENRAIAAVRKATKSKILGKNISGATHVIVNMTASEQFKLTEYDEILEEIRNTTSVDVNVIAGTAINTELGDELIVTIIATGLPEDVEVDQTESFAKEISKNPLKQTLEEFTPRVKSKRKLEELFNNNSDDEFEKDLEVRQKQYKEKKEEKERKSIFPSWFKRGK